MVVQEREKRMTKTKQYRMRNLPCRDASGYEMPYAVCGNHAETFPDGTTINGAGVLEWCWDTEDAYNILMMMRMDERFSNLTVRATN
jgi:hypothetical protein